MKQPDFQNTHSIQEALNQVLGAGAALALGMGTIRIVIPENERAELIGFIARLQEIEVRTASPAKVVLNENTGTIVMGGDVLIKPAYVAHGSLTIKIASTPVVTPPPVFSDADPVITELKDIEVEETTARFMPVQGTTAGEVAEALNRLQVTPRDMIAIFQALRELGALEADLETM
jgi:flagellar P-ring protein precursor FlgI